jgi:hypothetical protein
MYFNMADGAMLYWPGPVVPVGKTSGWPLPELKFFIKMLDVHCIDRADGCSLLIITIMRTSRSGGTSRGGKDS